MNATEVHYGRSHSCFRPLLSLLARALARARAHARCECALFWGRLCYGIVHTTRTHTHTVSEMVDVVIGCPHTFDKYGFGRKPETLEETSIQTLDT